MFEFFSKKPNLTVAKLIRTLRDIRLSNAIVEDQEYMIALGYNKMVVKLDKVNIIDITKINSSLQEEEHNVEIKLIDDKSNELTVYKPPILYVREKNSGKLLIKANDELSCCKVIIKNDLVKWMIKGNWCGYIVTKIDELELEINNQKIKIETEKVKREERIIKEKRDKVNNFNCLFKE
jgi:hypothetical protein